MQSQSSQLQRSLDTILKDQPYDNNLSLRQLLPQANLTKKSQQIKRDISNFIQSCFSNNKIVKEMIDLAVKSDSFSNQYQKSLALFSVDVLSGDICDSFKLFIKSQDLARSVRRTKSIRNEHQIQEQIEVQTSKVQDFNIQKYQNFKYLLEYMSRPPQQIPFVCMNYMTKILNHIVSNRAEDVYSYFAAEEKIADDSQNNVNKSLDTTSKTYLQYIIEHAHKFAGVSQMLGKMLAQQGKTNNYLQIKKLIIQGMLQLLKSEDLIRKSVEEFQYILDFVQYVLSRTKYKSDDQTQQLSKICQKFVDQNIIYYFYQRLVKAVIDSNKLVGNLSSPGTYNLSQSQKSIKTQNQVKPQSQQQFRLLQNTFQNSLSYLRIIIQRINSDEENDKYSNQTEKPQQSTMDFQVNEALFGQNSLYQMMTLQIPYKYKSINKMNYYEFLLKITRNSRYNKDFKNHMGIQPTSYVSILAHLLKIFRRQSKRNGLVNFYVQQILFEAILSKIQKLDSNQAMIILSALDPTQQILNNFVDTNAYIKKMVIILSRKCDWFAAHFEKLGIKTNQVKQDFLIKLGGNSSTYLNKKFKPKQLQFLNQELPPSKNNNKKNRERSQKFEDSESSQQQQVVQFKPHRQFQYPQQTKNENKTQNMQNQDLQQNLFRVSNNSEQIKKQQKLNEQDLNAQNDQTEKKRLKQLIQQGQILEQIKLSQSEQLPNDTRIKTSQKDPSEKLMELLLDSAGQSQGEEDKKAKTNSMQTD